MISDTDYQLDELEANIPALDQHWFSRSDSTTWTVEPRWRVEYITDIIEPSLIESAQGAWGRPNGPTRWHEPHCLSGLIIPGQCLVKSALSSCRPARPAGPRSEVSIKFKFKDHWLGMGPGPLWSKANDHHDHLGEPFRMIYRLRVNSQQEVTKLHSQWPWTIIGAWSMISPNPNLSPGSC
jgi:hypothetical protein